MVPSDDARYEPHQTRDRAILSLLFARTDYGDFR